VSGFSADWLRQREPFDAAARAEAAVPLRLADWMATRRHGAGVMPWRVIDLGCGTGANLRVLAPQLGGVQHWLAVDHDADLLACWPQALSDVGEGLRVVQKDAMLRLRGPGFDATIERRPLDLASQLETLPFDSATLVTASALLDLVSATWLQRLVDACSRARAAALFTLSVDGRHLWDPVDPDDAQAGALFDAHQQRDKGFGPALGLRAIGVAADAFRAAGYTVQTAQSDWWLDGRSDPAARELQCALIDGIAGAAIEQDPSATHALQAWRSRRLAMAGSATLRVGHVDLLATPPD
jgi:SAM-dependent methyltransferase